METNLVIRKDRLRAKNLAVRMVKMKVNWKASWKATELVVMTAV